MRRTETANLRQAFHRSHEVNYLHHGIDSGFNQNMVKLNRMHGFRLAEFIWIRMIVVIRIEKTEMQLNDSQYSLMLAQTTSD